MTCLCTLLPQNIDFMPTILSRFDMIFIIKDEHNVQKDMVWCGKRLLHSKCLSSRFSHPISPPPPSPAPGQACPARPPQCSSDAGGRHGGRRTEPASTQEVHRILQKVRRRRPKSHSTHVLSKSYSSQGVCVFSTLPSSFSLYSSTLLPPCSKCGPRLSAQSAEKLANRYVSMRTVTRQHEKESSQRISIPITVRFAAVVNS